MAAIEATTRAYTLKVSGEDKWRELLWTTHCTVNRGVRVWGDWLLTLRGGLPPSLADDDPDRRVVLALSWLSVESPRSLVPQNHIVACGEEPTEDRRRMVTARFHEILERLAVADREEWIAACEPALTARIRSDAVWVDRFAAFQQLTNVYPGLSHQWAAATLFTLLGDVKDYFTIPDTDADASTEGKDFVIKAGNWLSAHWGAGEKSDAGAIALNLAALAATDPSALIGKSGSEGIAALLAAPPAAGGKADPDKLFKQLKQAVGWKGRPSKGAMALQKLLNAEQITGGLWDEVAGKLREESADQQQKAGASSEAPSWMPDFRSHVEQRIDMRFRVQRDNIWEYAVMLDHALRRVSAGHTWIKRAEAKRRQFQEDAAKIDRIPSAAREWLDTYTENRSTDTGSVEGYLMRKRAIEGWEKVVQRWSKKDCNLLEDRVAKARELQADPDIDKFGDIQLFEALAVEDALCVRQNENGKPDAGILKDYVAARVAEHDRRRFKVPAYCHPDPLRHPVFVDFGNSRWSIEYSALKAVQEREKAQTKLDKAKSDKAREKLRVQLAEKPDLHGVTLSLWTGEVVEPQPLRWHGKRLRKDLDFNHFEGNGAMVSRADRLGRSIGGEPNAAVNIAQVFDQKEWNGRLQVPRRQLDRLADLIYGKPQPADERPLEDIHGTAAKVWQRLDWFLSLSAKLQPAGPWLDYVDEHELHPGNPKGIEYKKGRNGWYLNYEANKGRKRRVWLMLSRLPGLRVLSVDLGERHAGACAVWHTLSNADFRNDIANGEVIAGGTGPQHLFAHVKKTGDDAKERTTIYRRIGPDELNGEPHPAPWARLDRQFLVKLQGEDHKARRARAEEYAVFKDLCDSLGKQIDEPREELDLTGATTLYPRIDALIRDAVIVARRGLGRYGDCARIAFALQSTSKPLAGGRIYSFDKPNRWDPKDSPEERRKQHLDFILDALVRWQELAGSRNYADSCAKHLWDDWVIGKFGGPQPVELDETITRSERRKKLDESREPLKAVALKLLERDNADLHQLWSDEWNRRIQDFQNHLRRLRRMILPRIGQRPAGGSSDFQAWKQKAKELRHVGGLSYARLAAVRELYQLLRAFHMPPEPHNLRAGIERIEKEAEKGYRFGLRILRTLDRLRENRVKQLASRLVEAALGVGSEDSSHWEKGRKRPRKRIDDPRFAPCHAIVIEDLERYRPDEKRTRRENRGLMNWAARNVRKYLMEGCQLYGLHFDEVDPRYTSRQDSRTGLPGMRCDDVTIEEFTKTGGYWQRQVADAKKHLDKGGTRSRDQMLLVLSNRATQQADKPVRIPQKGGKLFVAAHSDGATGGGLHADLNAAANIGLRALLDPDWEGTWWYLPVKAADGKPVADKLAGCAVMDFEKSHFEQATSDKKEIVNVWRDPSSIGLSQSAWMQYTPYWNAVEWRVVERLRDYNGLKKPS